MTASPDFASESDVEQKFLFDLLTAPGLLGIPVSNVRTKKYLPPTDIDKSAGKIKGYYPDYSVWIGGFVPLIVEAKDASVAPEKGFSRS